MAVTGDLDDGLRAGRRGATHIIFRAIGTPLARQLSALRDLVAGAGIPVLAHSRADLAIAAGTAGLHLPADDLPVPMVRRLIGSEGLIGRSAHGASEVLSAGAEGADYVLFGPIFPTPTHPGRPGLGLGELGTAVRSSSVPIVAIGGIDEARGRDCLSVGAAGYAAIRLFRA